MNPYLKAFLGVCFLQLLPLDLNAQYYGYRFTVPVSPGASNAPVIPETEEELPLFIRPLPPPRPRPPPPMQPLFPPPQTMEPTQTELENGDVTNERRNFSFLPQDQIAPDRALDVLDFWFGLLPNPAYFPRDQLSIWFSASPEVDRQIRENFSQDVLNATHGEYNYWRDTPKGRLALILLLDQFPRHIYRNTPQSFAFDRMARALVLEGMHEGDDKNLYPIERAFFYLPLEHAEDPEMQALSVAAYRQLLVESPMPIKQQMRSFLQFANMHKEQIDRFGRFPHRNPILGRESTHAESVFFKQWGRSSILDNHSEKKSPND